MKESNFSISINKICDRKINLLENNKSKYILRAIIAGILLTLTSLAGFVMGIILIK